MLTAGLAIRFAPTFVLLLAGCAAQPRTAAPPPTEAQPRTGLSKCQATPMRFAADTTVIDVIHVTTGADGLSHGVVQPMEGATTVYLGATLRQFQLGSPSKVVIVTGPPNFKLPPHAAPYREMFLLLAGSTELQLSDGSRFPLRPGSAVLTEDTTGPGHGGQVGPCGYVALDLQFK
jgi:quercetin dioxygenase-like cupin family protein